MALNGTWKIDRNENYEKFMEAMGINIMKRKLGAHDNLKITIQQDGNKFTVTESSNFRNIDIEFTLGVNFEYSLADGTELTCDCSGVLAAYIEDHEVVLNVNGSRMHCETQASLQCQKIRGCWNMEGNKLVGTFTRKDNGKVLKAFREIVGDELVQTYVYEGVEAKRIFKRG